MALPYASVVFRLRRDKNKKLRPLYDIPYMFEAREFLRKKLIGKKVNVTVDYIRPASPATETVPAFSERTCATVTIGGIFIAYTSSTLVEYSPTTHTAFPALKEKEDIRSIWVIQYILKLWALELLNSCKFAKQPGLYHHGVCAERRGHVQPLVDGLEEIVPVATVLHKPQLETESPYYPDIEGCQPLVSSLWFSPTVEHSCTAKERNIAEALVSKGLATVIRYRQDDDQRSSHYDELLAAEARAIKNGKGLHSKKEVPIHRVADISGTRSEASSFFLFQCGRPSSLCPSVSTLLGCPPLMIDIPGQEQEQCALGPNFPEKRTEQDFADTQKAKQFLPFLQRAGRSEAVVEYVFSGSRLKLYLPKETCLITFLLAGPGAHVGASVSELGYKRRVPRFDPSVPADPVLVLSCCSFPPTTGRRSLMQASVLKAGERTGGYTVNRETPESAERPVVRGQSSPEQRIIQESSHAARCPCTSIECPRGARNLPGLVQEGEPFSEEATLFTKELVLQREAFLNDPFVLSEIAKIALCCCLENDILVLDSKLKTPAAALTYFPSSCWHQKGGCPPGELILQATVAKAQPWIPFLPLPLLF
ncbi:hypothetical protein CB1_000757035 [Camelus ferus]|nr:hypothetical protein CB1_000757035 [Camelus ferus]